MMMSSNCCFCDRSFSNSTTNGEPARCSLSSRPNNRCQLHGAGAAKARVVLATRRSPVPLAVAKVILPCYGTSTRAMGECTPGCTPLIQNVPFVRSRHFKTVTSRGPGRLGREQVRQRGGVGEALENGFDDDGVLQIEPFAQDRPVPVTSKQSADGSHEVDPAAFFKAWK